MITKQDLEAGATFMHESSDASPLTPDLAGNALAEPGASELPAPALPSGAEILLPALTENAGVIARADTGLVPGPAALETALALLHEGAARHAEIAAQFARTGDRRNARAHLQRAAEQLNDAEIED